MRAAKTKQKNQADSKQNNKKTRDHIQNKHKIIHTDTHSNTHTLTIVVLHTHTHTHTSRSKVNTAASLTLDVRRMKTVSDIQNHLHSHKQRASRKREREREGKQNHRTCASFKIFAYFLYTEIVEKKSRTKRSLCYPNSTFEN